MRDMKRVLINVSIAAAFVLAAAGVVYAAVFATPDSPVAAVSESPEAVSADSPRAVPPPNPTSPLASDIPGCVCHSNNPKLVEEHAAYRMNQCFGCHGDVPTGQR